MRNKTESLADLLASSGMGLRQAAEAAGIGRSSLWRWIHGRARPQSPQVSALAATLGVRLDRLMAAVEVSRRKARRAAVV